MMLIASPFAGRIAEPVVVKVFVMLDAPYAFQAVRVTTYVHLPGMLTRTMRFCAVEKTPLENSQRQDVGFPVDVSVNRTTQGTFVLVMPIEKFATGARASGPTVMYAGFETVA
jgi:hypothetical protein